MRVPVLPTLIVAAAVAAMIGLGIWQLQRAQWKEGLIAELESSGARRAATIECAVDAVPEVRAGRNRGGEVGYRYLVPCRARGGEVMLDLGWSRRPDALRRLERSGAFAGTISGAGREIEMLVLERPMPPLEPSALPAAAEIPNNHLLYALQWFFFAAAAAVIYALALRRKSTGD